MTPLIGRSIPINPDAFSKKNSLVCSSGIETSYLAHVADFRPSPDATASLNQINGFTNKSIPINVTRVRSNTHSCSYQGPETHSLFIYRFSYHRLDARLAYVRLTTQNGAVTAQTSATRAKDSTHWSIPIRNTDSCPCPGERLMVCPHTDSCPTASTQDLPSRR